MYVAGGWGCGTTDGLIEQFNQGVAFAGIHPRLMTGQFSEEGTERGRHGSGVQQVDRTSFTAVLVNVKPKISNLLSLVMG